MEMKFSEVDILTIKKAFQANISTLVVVILIFSAAEGYGIYSMLQKAVDAQVLDYLFVTMPLIPIFRSVIKIINLRSEVKNGKKMVVFSECKKMVEYGDNPQDYLLIEKFGRVNLTGYNHEVYFSFFTDQPDFYEIHIASKSKVILFAKKIDRDNAIV